MSAPRKPIVGIPCDRRMAGHHPFQMVGEKYIRAVREGASALPLLLPMLEQPIPAAEILAAVDGLFFPGSPSNVGPAQYGGPAPREGVLQDAQRDSTSLPLLREAIALGMPIFCVCRGFQELNVAMGGTLYQHVEEVEGRFDHREDKSAPLDRQYAPVHDVRVIPGGVLQRLLSETAFRVNSLHGQGINRLAPRLRSEAEASDGMVEAVSMPDAKGFVLGAQWHPEWKWSDNPISRKLFAAFGEALAAFAVSRA